MEAVFHFAGKRITRLHEIEFLIAAPHVAGDAGDMQIGRALNYSLDVHGHGWEHLWIDDKSPFPEPPLHINHKIKFRLLSCRAPKTFPRQFIDIGDLLALPQCQPYYATLLLKYNFSPDGLGSIRIALSAEAVKQIKGISGQDYQYELTLDDFELTDVTPKQT